ncbi:phosphatidylinositol 4-kinase beta 1 [Amborella trichopoda]|uniref:1-phosphatidylinositol 4-kinase n=1 Tax=Amborella trichopoda TaxID=13333 RepID=W1P5Q6_AMBTC|nr:phosphatidylinositol 4-kinase beta 1 [Amborella trichopoda]ERN05182.1 hypothetical protein AMTR_s00053p00224010 [Amborella trichopoda]|eukprot:XP_006843507.1 phosphatidylinositol 4-kinase beta 1 [Amborella trichopoda]
MVRLLGLTRGESDESPKEITRIPSETGESGWLIRFFDSAFFCEWIAVSYLYKHDHPGVRDYLCNRMYTLPLSGIESYLFQICYMLVHRPSPSLDKFVIDVCSKSLQIALKVHWFLMAELEDTDDNEGISRIQEKCQMAATLMGDWPPLVRPQNPPSSPGSKNRVLNKILSSKQRLLSLTSSPPTLRSISLPSHSPTTNNPSPHEENKNPTDESDTSLKVLKKFMPGPKVRDALFFRKSVEKDEDDVDKSKDASKESDQDSFFKRLLSVSKDEDERAVHSEELTASSEGFFKRLFRDRSDGDDKATLRAGEEDEKDGFFRRLFKDKFDDHEKKDGDDEDKGTGSYDEEDFLPFRRLFRVHPEDEKPVTNNSGSFESSPGSENFFRRLFRDRDRSVEDSELFGLKKQKEKRPGSPRQRSDKAAKPPLPNNIISQLRKDTYHASLDFVLSLCETSYGLVDIFPMEDRKRALRESLVEINSHLAAARNSGGVCFPMGKGMYRVVHIPEDEAVLLNSREKAPYLICVEVLKGESPSSKKDQSDTQKLSRGGIPLANGDAQLQKPPPWAYPLQDVHHNGTDQMLRSASQAIDQAMAHLWEAKVKFVHVSLSLEKHTQDHTKKGEVQDTECNGQEDNGQLISVSGHSHVFNGQISKEKSRADQEPELGWVNVTLTAVPGVNMEDVEDQEPVRRKDHRRVPSTIAMAEVKAAAEKGEAPPGLPLKRVGDDSADAQSKVSNGGLPKPTDALSGELWEVKKERIRNASVYGKSPDWDLRSLIVKSGDDCRQEHLAVQLISHFYDIYQEAGLPLWLRPYEVLVTSSYTALIETIPDTASLHAIKSRFPNVTSLRDFFVAKYQENSPSFKLAQRNFVESMAGYSILCYLLQVKDRHNGNLLMDEEGHIIHIDFGFMLSNSPGNVNFESAPFKLTRELLEVMDSDAEGIPSEFFDYFKVLCIQGFLTCRKHAERIILLVEMLQDSGFPCFRGGPRTIQNLRKRFHLSLTEEQCVSLVLSLISSSLDAWRTRQYDYYQRVLNGIL